MNEYALAKLVSPAVFAVYEKFTKKVNGDKKNEIRELVAKLVFEGKKPERALADALETYKMSGAVE